MDIHYIRSPQNVFEPTREEIVYIHVIPEDKDFPQIEKQLRVNAGDVISMAYDGKQVMVVVKRKWWQLNQPKNTIKKTGMEYITILTQNSQPIAKAVLFREVK